MFNKNFDLESLNAFGKNTLPGLIGIEFTELGDDFIIARMPVDSRTHQPFGILHGGASVVLAETIGSIASMLCLENPELQKAVGLEINANHLRAVKTGWVYGKVTPIHVGAKTHVWDIKITNEENKPVCICRLTTMII
ncbi:hotdog fold thioesterase [Lacihabitans sp. CS3-21]|jgi:1,4-dihydroxy-2-naphthoyl-CoA hydrolase|uniref:hotdog fold thioesterase n=1 Tax=Lacihabitans sp. CS3-21 TaxID=2487332 RepID=UPI0020CD5928|nr:hotdog fold thioesterase [Lacihabitans sp. CS3-21]MCP9747986.1 hotdog fold thioesterase [Lacihabitans sp. CS3-21]MDP1817067.1 hotdog fold thioesterase [Leadbetterella sp.]